MAADSIYDKADLAALGDELPPELKGKTPKEIIQHYERREALMQERLQRQQREQIPPAKETPVDDKIDMFNDPAGSVDRVVTRKVNERMNAFEQRVSQNAAPAIINSCRLALRDRYPDYMRYAKEIDKRMATFTPEAQMNPEYWDYTYKLVKADAVDALVSEARADERAKLNPVERSTPPGQKPPAPRELSDEEKSVAGKFGLSHEDYRAAAERYESTDGRLPITLDNRGRRRKRTEAATKCRRSRSPSRATKKL